MAAPLPSQSLPENQTRCPHEDEWYCKLLEKPCHPGIKGCALDGERLIDALIAFTEKDKEPHPSSP